jgi:pseudouridine-5'-phosphate glycosidase
MATGGIGGVHRGYDTRPDVSADIPEIARARTIVVCSGVKSLLDVEATLELLETLGVPVLGFRTDTLPLFYAVEGGPPVPARADSTEHAARIAAAHWALGRTTGLVVARPPDPSLEDVGPLIEEALAAAEDAAVRVRQ